MEKKDNNGNIWGEDYIVYIDGFRKVHWKVNFIIIGARRQIECFEDRDNLQYMEDGNRSVTKSTHELSDHHLTL